MGLFSMKTRLYESQHIPHRQAPTSPLENASAARTATTAVAVIAARAAIIAVAAVVGGCRWRLSRGVARSKCQLASKVVLAAPALHVRALVTTRANTASLQRIHVAAAETVMQVHGRYGYG